VAWSLGWGTVRVTVRRSVGRLHSGRHRLPGRTRRGAVAPWEPAAVSARLGWWAGRAGWRPRLRDRCGRRRGVWPSSPCILNLRTHC